MTNLTLENCNIIIEALIDARSNYSKNASQYRYGKYKNMVENYNDDVYKPKMKEFDATLEAVRAIRDELKDERKVLRRTPTKRLY